MSERKWSFCPKCNKEYDGIYGDGHSIRYYGCRSCGGTFFITGLLKILGIELELKEEE